MKVASSLRSLKKRKDCKLIRRRGKVHIISKNKKFKARQR